jgi:hypothetical protein
VSQNAGILNDIRRKLYKSELSFTGTGGGGGGGGGGVHANI